MDGDEIAASIFTPPSRVSLSRLFPSASRSSRRLSSRYSAPSRPDCLPRRKLSWISLQGRLDGVDDATSARSVGPGLTRDEAVAWELFSPLHRVLLVALVAAATSRSKASRKIAQLQRSIDLRDLVLQSMQEKLDCLCEEMNSLQDQYNKYNALSSPQKLHVKSGNKLLEEEAKSCSSDHLFQETNLKTGADNLSTQKLLKQDKSGIEEENSLIYLVEQEERRMSDLSDFCWSIASSMDSQEFYNLRRECEEKDTIIKELSAAAQSSSIADSKRIAELQEIVKRKNLVISKLKKDMTVLKQMVIELTRAKRSSSVSPIANCTDFPVMSSNILYDMSSTSPSSSDSESPSAQKQNLVEDPVMKFVSKENLKHVLSSESLDNNNNNSNNSRAKKNRSNNNSPLTENRINERGEIVGSASKYRKIGSSNGEFKRTRRGSQHESKSMAQRRWV